MQKLKKLKSLSLINSKKLIQSLIYFLLITILFLSQILAPLELAIYDFNFWIRPVEPIEDRIVVVGWDESSIQILEENTISDDVLLSLLKKINRQEPRIIGLDLYRDIPVFSPRLSDGGNVQAYEALQELLRFIPNIIAIEKVIEPIVKPPNVLKERELTVASDLPTDRDKVLRRSFVIPQKDENEQPAGIPYLGVVLGFKYLSAEGWNAIPTENKVLKILKSDREFTLNPVKNFAGVSPLDRYGYDFLVNWRKANPAFKTVSVIDVVNDLIDPELFRDRVVIIGNIAASTADRHYTSLNRWSEESASVTYGVEIPAQVASSIISAAIDKRPLITPASKLWEIVIIIISVGTITKYTKSITTKYQQDRQDLNLPQLYLRSFICTVIICFVLFLLNLFSFNVGMWIPIAKAWLCVAISYLMFCYYIYSMKKRENTDRLEAYVLDLHHSLADPLKLIELSVETLPIVTLQLQDSLLAISSEKLPQELDKIEIILERASDIEIQTQRIQRYRTHLDRFVRYGYLNQKNNLQKIQINDLVDSIITRFIEEVARIQFEHQVEIYQKLDPSITYALIDPIALEIVLENLLDNAFYAITPQNDCWSKIPNIKVETLLKNKYIQFTVQDNGPGVPLHLQQAIFESFRSFNRQPKQGIGLFLCRKILNSYGGNIIIKSDGNNHGSKFIFTLPYANNLEQN